MKKQVSETKQHVLIGEVAKEVVKKARNAKKAQRAVEQQPAGILGQGEEQKPQETRKKKVVDFRISKGVIRNETDKAILLIVHTGEQATKLWLPKSQTNVLTDADDTEKLVVRVAGWLWFRHNLGEMFKAERWATEKE